MTVTNVHLFHLIKMKYPHFHILAFTHAELDVNSIGWLHREESESSAILQNLLQEGYFQEILFLSTCNRVEFACIARDAEHFASIAAFLRKLYPSLSDDKVEVLTQGAQYFQGEAAVHHFMRVACSIDSMVIGEREIITQVRKAYEWASSENLTGDFLRLLVKQTIATAKKVYTQTDISRKPVSVVSLAYQRMRELNIPLDARILVVGAGITNTTLSRFLKKHGYKHFHIFNRTVEKAQKLAEELNGKAYSLDALKDFTAGFDVLVACTGSDHHLVTPALYDQLLAGETDKKLVIDIAIPQDLHPEILHNHAVHHISVSFLQQQSDENLKFRSKEIQQVERFIQLGQTEFESLQKERAVEIAMRSVPQQVKNIKSTALNEVFKEEMERLDPQSQAVLEKMLGYMEKKYMSLPMKMAKEILLQKSL